jgi:hypothetical protein
MLGLPPTGKAVHLPGADFIRVAGDKIKSVEGYFDSRAVPEQLGLQIVVQPKTLGPYTFGTSVRVAGGTQARPAAFSITALHARTPQEQQAVEQQSRAIVPEMMQMPGFLGFVGVTVGGRMLTITAWESPENPRQLLRGGLHGEAMKKFFEAGLGGGGYTSVWTAERINTAWVRCPACGKMAGHSRPESSCSCGARLPEPMPFW